VLTSVAGLFVSGLNIDMKTITLPMLDHTPGNQLSRIVGEARAAGAVSANNFDDPSTFTLTFAKEADAKAFKAESDALLNVTGDVPVIGEGDPA
jgi:hypothetical protein